MRLVGALTEAPRRKHTWLGRLAARPALSLFVFALLVYNLNLKPIASGDTAPAALLPFSVFLDGTITYDRFTPWLDAQYNGRAYFFRQVRGHSYSFYPILHGLVVTPLYTPLLLFPGLRHWNAEQLVLLARLMEKVTASIVAAFAVALFYILARRFLTTPNAVLLAVIFGFGTNTFSTSAQALWQHGMSELMIVASLLCLDKFLAKEGGRIAWAGAGLFAALSVAVRPTNVLFAAAACAVAALSQPRWRLLASYGLFGALTAAALISYNLSLFSDVRGGYALPLRGAMLSGLAGLLFSPGRGLFVYSPVLLFVFPALYVWLRRGPQRGASVLLVSLLFSIAHILLYTRWRGWWGGYCFGPRLLTDILPCLMLLLIPVFQVLDRARAAKAAFVALAVLSIGIHLVGTYSYPKGRWDPDPLSVDRHPERLWDWGDNPILRNAAAGPDLMGYMVVADRVAAGLTGRPLDPDKLKIRVK